MRSWGFSDLLLDSTSCNTTPRRGALNLLVFGLFLFFSSVHITRKGLQNDDHYIWDLGITLGKFIKPHLEDKSPRPATCGFVFGQPCMMESFDRLEAAIASFRAQMAKQHKEVMKLLLQRAQVSRPPPPPSHTTQLPPPCTHLLPQPLPPYHPPFQPPPFNQPSQPPTPQPPSPINPSSQSPPNPPPPPHSTQTTQSTQPQGNPNPQPHPTQPPLPLIHHTPQPSANQTTQPPPPVNQTIQ